MAKKIIIGVVVLIAVIAAGVFVLYSNLGEVIKAAIEKYGSEATQARVTVNSVKLSATSGEGSISGLMIGNPKGFSTSHAFELGAISLAVDTGTITKNPVVIKSIVIEGPRVTFEQGSSGNNLQKLQQNVNQYAGASAPAKSSSNSSASAPADKKDERKLIIESLDIRGAQASVSAAPLKGRTLTVSLPTIHMADIGKKEGGATPAEVAQRLIGAMSDQAAKASTAELQKALQEQIGKATGGNAGQIGDQLKGLLGK